MEKTTKIPLFRRCVIQNFPFIEEDFDALTDYGLLCKVVEYLNKVINQTNTNSEQVEELSTAFNSLKSYVDNYFDNLDVQDEINTKLEAMAASGQLADIISQYLNSTAIFGYDSVADMKSAENLVAGSYARTLGYYSANDGGGALYKIRAITNDDTVDEAFIVEMADDDLVAEMIISDNRVDIRQLGARSQDTADNRYDINSYIAKYDNYLQNSVNRLALYIPSGIWYCSDYNFTHNKGYEIYGDKSFPNSEVTGTIISSYNNNQEYIFKFGGNATRCDNVVLKDITFTSANISYDSVNSKFEYGTPKAITHAVMMWYACYSQVDNIFFIYINGNGLNIRSCWECYFGKLNFRQVSSYADGVLTFDTADTSLVAGADCSANNFNDIMFEATHGHLIESKYQSGLKNTHFGRINFETNHYVLSDEVYTAFDGDTSGYDPATATHFAMFKGGMRIVVDSIELMNLARWFWTHNSNTYVYDRIVEADTNYESYNGGSLVAMNIDNIMTEGMLKDAELFYNNLYISRESQFNVGKVINRTGFDLIPNFNGGFGINIETPLGGYEVPAGRYTFLGDFTPFKDIVIRNIGNSVQRGIIYYDADASNNSKLVVRPYNDSNLNHEQMRMLAGSQTLLIRAKIPNAETVDLYLRNRDKVSTVAITETLTGDGNYKNYTIDCSDLCVAGENISVRLANGETGKNISLDYYKFI